MIAFTFPTGQLQLVEDNVRRDFLSAQRGVQIRRPRGRAEHRQDDQIRQLTEQFANGRLQLFNFLEMASNHHEPAFSQVRVTATF